MKKTEKKSNTKTTYSSLTEKDQDIRNPRPVKRVNPQEQAAAIEKTRRTGETRKQYPVRSVNDPS